MLGLRKGRGRGLLAVVAHLDTVFPEGTDVKVKRDGTKLLAPGVSDDSRGLAVMLAAVRAINGAGIDTDADLLFVGSVGEEGEGDLRGVRYLFDKGKYKDRITAFLAIDGPDPGRLVNGALGSKRYRVTFKGPGGHSYNAFGLVSPAFAMADAIHRLGALKVPPKTTFNVGVVSGGTSVNSIPVEMSMDVDLRSESRAELDKVSLAFATMVRDAVEAENKTRSTAQGRLTADTMLIGDRPSGETSIESPFIQRVAAAMRAFGLKPNYEFQSSDTNIPISREIPAVASAWGHRRPAPLTRRMDRRGEDIVGEGNSVHPGDHCEPCDGLRTPSTTRLEGSCPARRLAPPSSRGAAAHVITAWRLRFRTGGIPLVRLASGDVNNNYSRRW